MLFDGLQSVLGISVDFAQRGILLRKWDQNKDGIITRSTFINALETFEKLEEAVDIDSVDLVRQKVVRKLHEQTHKILSIFRKFDVNHDGDISYDEFRTALNDMHIKLKDEEFDALIRSIDVDGDGEVQFEELEKLINEDGRANNIILQDYQDETNTPKHRGKKSNKLIDSKISSI